MRGYYLVRPLLPRPLQLRLRRAVHPGAGRLVFPGWPIEDSLHDFYDWLFAMVADLAGRPVPFLDLWPDGRSWALVLTHDVETDVGYRDMDLLRGAERARGYRSSWNFVGAALPGRRRHGPLPAGRWMRGRGTRSPCTTAATWLQARAGRAASGDARVCQSAGTRSDSGPRPPSGTGT